MNKTTQHHIVLMLFAINIFLFMLCTRIIIKESHREHLCEQNHGVYLETQSGYQCFARIEK